MDFIDGLRHVYFDKVIAEPMISDMVTCLVHCPEVAPGSMPVLYSCAVYAWVMFVQYCPLSDLVPLCMVYSRLVDRF